ncbi:MAG: DNA polymerase/3'-5' exonuclease PolX [Burkholderiales bacterium]
MPIHNADTAAIFTGIADLLEIEAANSFRVRAYRNAARMLSELPVEIKTMIDRGDDLRTLPGIGEDLAGKIREIATTGKCALLERLHRELPPAITEMLKIPGLGPKRVSALYHDLDVQTPEQLARAARDGRIRNVPGFGEKTEQRILEAVDTHVNKNRRYKLAVAAQYAKSLTEYLRGAKSVKQVVVAGSYRRMRETVGDLDVLVSAHNSRDVMRRFIHYDEVAKVLSVGPTRASVVLKSGIQADLRSIAPESFGAALCYFTGSKAHNIALRILAQSRGLKLNEYGLFRDEQRIAGETEESVYQSLGLAAIPPELRENLGELQAARTGKLPQLIQLHDLIGDLHSHSKASDGHNGLREMAEAAKARGLRYLAITDHSRYLTVAHGLDAIRLAKQVDEIEQLNAGLSGITLLTGIEVDILEDGELDLPDAALARLDVVVAAVHSKFNLTRVKQTERILRAMQNPLVNILAHPSGRLLGEREPYEVDMPRVIRQAKHCGCFLELNAHPSRLDLLDTHCRMAKDEGVLVSINSDAHGIFEFDNLRYGVGQARRGWLEANDVLNTRPLNALSLLLKRRQNISIDHRSAA